jgi:glycosyltransferase involved in cell wall biosynthesis
VIDSSTALKEQDPPPLAPAATAPLHVVILDYRDIRHPEAGGAEVYMYEIFRRIAAYGHRVTWISAADAGAGDEREGNLRMLRVGNKVTANFTSARAALRVAREEPVDLFVENLCKIPFFLPAYTSAPVLPIVLHLFGETVFREANPLLASYVWMYERFIPRIYRGQPFVALSDSTAADLRRRGVEARWIDVVPPGLDLARFGAAPDGAREPLVAYVGRLKRYKQIELVLKAFARVHRDRPDARMVVLGKGDDRARLEGVVRKCGIEAVVDFRGFVSEEEKIGWMRRARVVVYPSPKEGWGISTTEAAACGTPVVASNSEGLRDAVRADETGFLVPHEDIAAWATRIASLLDDDALFARLSRGALVWAQEFDWETRATQMRLIIERAVTEARAARGETG